MPYKRKGSPFWWCRFEIEGHCHRSSTPYRHDEVGKKVAAQYEEALKVEARRKNAENGDGSDPAILTIKAAFTRYKGELDSTRGDFKDIVTDYDRLLHFFGEVLPLSRRPKFLADVTDDMVARLVTWRRDHHKWDRKDAPKLAPATVNRSSTERLMNVFNRAKNVWFRTLRSPFPKEPFWKTHILKEPKDRVRWVEPNEHKALTLTFDASYDALYRFHILSGLRMNECLLEKTQVKFAMGVITIQAKGDNEIHKPLTPGLVAILREVWNDHPTQVFTYVAERTRDGRIEGQRYPITYNGWKTYWYRRRKEAAATCPSLLDPTGKTTLRIHDLRHTFATNLQAATGDVRLTQVGMGHASSGTTEKYTHVMNRRLQAGMVKGEDEHYLSGLVKPEPVALLPKPTGTDDE